MRTNIFWLVGVLTITVFWGGRLTAAEVFLEQGAPINWSRLEELQPASAVLKDEKRAGYWTLRTKDWYRPLLNSSKGAPDLTLDPRLQGYYKIYALYRCVNWDTSFGLKLSSDKDFQVIKPALGTADNHWDDEALWKDAVKMDGEKITLHAVGDSVYFYGLRFVPVSEQKVGLKVTDHVVIMKDDSKHFAFPGVARAKNGDLLVVAREAKTHVSAGDYGIIALARSKDEGRTWEKRVTIAEKPKYDLRDPSIICLSDGTILATSTDGVRRSTDNGYTWEAPVPTPVFSPNGLAEGPDGNVYYVGLQWKGEIMFTNIIRSKDKGKTWEPFSTTWLSKGFIPGKRDYLDEPSLFISGNRWIVTHRYEVEDRLTKGYLYQQISNDSGNSWCWPRKTVMWGHPADVIGLPDKRLVCAYGYRRPPFGIRASVSYDRGETWDIANEIVIREDGGGSSLVGNEDLGYPKSVMLKDGRVLTVYYFNTKGTNAFIAGSFYAPPKR